MEENAVLQLGPAWPLDKFGYQNSILLEE